jgi:hypothetical protein
MTQEYILDVMAMFKVKYIVDGAIQALHFFLQKYSTLMDRDDWEHLAEDVKFVGPVDYISLFALQYQLAFQVQNKMCMGVITTNGEYRTSTAN